MITQFKVHEKSNTSETIPDLSIIIVSYNTKDMTRQCLKVIEKYSEGIDKEVIVVDNNSHDGSGDMISSDFSWVKLIRLTENRGFAGGNTPGMKAASGKYILLLNSDSFLTRNSLSNTISYMDKNPRIGILGCKLTNPDGSLQPSARMLPSPLNKFLTITGLAYRFSKSRFFGRVDFSWWDHSTPRSVGWVVGAFFLIRREAMEEIGYLDERYFLYFEEVDYCITARRKGWDVVFYPYASVVHIGGQSAVKTDMDISDKGAQVISIRLASEYKYYRKIYGLCYTVLSAMIEFIWNMVILVKNFIFRSEYSAYKRSMALVTMRLIVSILLKDNWGKGNLTPGNT